MKFCLGKLAQNYSSVVGELPTSHRPREAESEAGSPWHQKLRKVLLVFQVPVLVPWELSCTASSF